jgi:D-arabinose 1-dehydrogenase-like Zn-dependent alcohol dehydrogenase
VNEGHRCSYEGFATPAADQPLSPFSFERCNVSERDVMIGILYCGVCHSDLHQARNDWQNAIYPCVPGPACCTDIVNPDKGFSRD